MKACTCIPGYFMCKEAERLWGLVIQEYRTNGCGTKKYYQLINNYNKHRDNVQKR